MKRRLAALLALAIMTHPIPDLRAEAEAAKTDSDLTRYLEELQVKLEHTAQRSNQPTSSGSNVVGLRGSKQEPLSHQLYWKGKQGAGPVTPDEVKLLRAALEQARTGHKTEAVTMLQTFEQKYPKSALLPDARQTLQKLTASPAPETASPPALPAQ